MTNKTLRDYINLVENAQHEAVAEGKDDLSQYSTERLQAYVKKVSGGGVPAFGSGAKLKRVQAELKRREQGVAEGRFDEPLTGWHIVSRAHGQVVRGTPSFETKDQAQKYLMTRMFANHHEFKVVHTAGVAEGYTPSAGELARDLTKMPDSDFNKKYGMSKQQANHYYSSSKLKEQGVAEGSESSLKSATMAAWNAVVKKHPEWISNYGSNAVKRTTKEIVRRHWENMDQDNIDGILFHIEHELQDLDEEQLEETSPDAIKKIEQLVRK